MVLISSQRLIDLARITAIIACVGLLYSPSVGTIGLILTYVAFLASGQAVSRFKGVLARPLAYWGVAFLGVVLLGMLYASVPWHDRWTDFYKWRTILWFCVVLAIFGEEYWKERLLVMFLLGTAVAVLASFALATGWISVSRPANAVLRNSGTQGMAVACAALICVWVTLEKKPLGPILWAWPLLAMLYPQHHFHYKLEKRVCCTRLWSCNPSSVEGFPDATGSRRNGLTACRRTVVYGVFADAGNYRCWGGSVDDGRAVGNAH
jgi:hypothetical protein